MKKIDIHVFRYMYGTRESLNLETPKTGFSHEQFSLKKIAGFTRSQYYSCR